MKPETTVPVPGNEGPSAPAAPSRRSRRPRRPRRGVDLRTVLRGIGRVLISIGVLLFLFVGYQLWGTGVHHARGQDRLKAQFEEQLLTAPPTLPAPEGIPVAAAPAPSLGQAAALLEIPRIGMEEYVVEGVGVDDLKVGPGHYPDTPMPGEKGNAAIAGHRTTYGAPFYDVNELQAGDPIFVTTPAGRFRYEVSELLVVSPEDVWVLDPTDDDRLTLTTCEPRYSAAERLIVVASLVSDPVVVAEPTEPAEPAETAAPAEPADPAEATPARSLDSAGLSGEDAARTPTVVWGAAAAAVWFGAWLVGRSRRRWLVYLIASPAFFFALYHFYENVARLLPANA